jgi:hypothetical protein
MLSTDVPSYANAGGRQPIGHHPVRQHQDGDRARWCRSWTRGPPRSWGFPRHLGAGRPPAEALAQTEVRADDEVAGAGAAGFVCQGAGLTAGLQMHPVGDQA